MFCIVATTNEHNVVRLLVFFYVILEAEECIPELQ